MAALLRGLVPATDLTMNLFQIGNVVEMLVWVRTLSLKTERADREAQGALARTADLESQARTDPLTGLLNRRGLTHRLQTALSAPDVELCVLLLDLNGFKGVNDRHGHGHDTGDALLCAVAGRLKNSVRAGDHIARLGGDEFVIVAMGVPGDEPAQALVRTLQQSLERAFDVNGIGCTIGASIGYAVAPLHGMQLEELIRHADRAMYRGKQGRQGIAAAGVAHVHLDGADDPAMVTAAPIANAADSRRQPATDTREVGCKPDPGGQASMRTPEPVA